MYHVALPFMTKYRTEAEWDISVRELRRAKLDEVFLIYYRKLADRGARDEMNALFTDNKHHLENAGFTVSAWVAPTIGYGSPVDEVDRNAAKKYRKIQNSLGAEAIAFCPTDKDFFDDLCEQLAEVAGLGIKRILLEDDFTLTGGKLGLHGLGCCCDEHMKRLNERLDKPVSREELHSFLVSGPKNPCRTAFFELCGETLLSVAHGIEQAVHRVDPNIRIGLSANASSYHLEGADFLTLERTIAGAAKPFVRLTGAPYWKDNASTIAPTIEAARMQGAWCRRENIENLTEGDTYPRPRFVTPANYLEMFDMILRADSNSDGILKYMHDYNSSDAYETGYIDHHTANAEAYAELERRFGGKNVGLCVYEAPFSLSEVSYDETFSYLGFVDHGILPLVSQWLTTECSLPTTYDENAEGAKLVFGHNASLLPEEHFSDGLILDMSAAVRLMERGVDVGISACESAPKPGCEYFRSANDTTSAATERPNGFFRVTLKESAEVLSEFCLTDSCLGTGGAPTEDTDRYPACFRYENESGQRFLVYTFAAYEVKTKGHWSNGLFRNYYRRDQLIDSYAWLCGRRLPAVCRRAPYLYILCKRDGSTLHIGLFNLSPDFVFHPDIELDQVYRSVDCYHCAGRLEKNGLHLEEPLAPYSYAFISCTE